MISRKPPERTTSHRVHLEDARRLEAIDARSVHLVVTSPPYPMIEMWDEVFSGQDARVREALEAGDGWKAFRRMHEILDAVWREVTRVLVPGGIACINIGDATRTIGGSFALYPNHARILTAFLELGFTPLPAILWRKQTNAPNKFMGSGMFPPGAYVTLEHEYVLILRKGDKRLFLSGKSKSNRRGSAFFWEERNSWYSDVWFDLKGARQSLLDREARKRSGAFPFELAYRLISMFSLKGDTVLDPFLGVGTTMLAAMATARNSVGYEIDPGLASAIAEQVPSVVPLANARIDERLSAHADFVRSRCETKGAFGYRNEPYGFPVVTRQEMNLLLNRLQAVDRTGEGEYEVRYSDRPQRQQVGDWDWFFNDDRSGAPKKTTGRRAKKKETPEAEAVQLDLLSLDGE